MMRYNLQEITSDKNYTQFVLNFPQEIFDSLNLKDKFIEFRSGIRNGMILIPREKNGGKYYAINPNAQGVIRITIPRAIVSFINLKKTDTMEYKVEYDENLKQNVIFLLKVEE